jgi:hypothetical protein
MPDAETILRVILNPEKFENRPLGDHSSKWVFADHIEGRAAGANNDVASVENTSRNGSIHSLFRYLLVPIRESKDKFCKRFAIPFGHSGTFGPLSTF